MDIYGFCTARRYFLHAFDDGDGPYRILLPTLEIPRVVIRCVGHALKCRRLGRTVTRPPYLQPDAQPCKRGEREGGGMAIHLRQVRQAFGEDLQPPARPAKVIRLVGDQVELLQLDGVAVTVTVVDLEAFDEGLQRDDLCRLLDMPLALVNERRHLLALAIGPPDPPSRLEVQWGVSILHGGSVVEIPSPDEGVQPAWRLFELGAESDNGPALDRV